MRVEKFKDEIKIMALYDMENGIKKGEILRARSRILMGYQVLSQEHLGEIISFNKAVELEE